ncbi:MAG: hypothetical protein E7291_03320 [Lachnospiraceae bacterium]|nr:hypothetical protein [Lachnospiraceae bacterium]
MMSRNSFFKRMKYDLEQRIWLPVLFFIISFLTMEIVLISEFEALWSRATRQTEMLQASFFAERAHDFLLNNFWAPNVGSLVLTIAVAAVSGLSGFAFLHSAKKLDVYHSLPIKRERLFLQQYIYGILYYIVPLLLHVIICLGICAANGMLSGAVLGQALCYVLVQLLIYLVCYAVILVAVCLTGNTIISVLGSAILLTYSLVVVLLKSELMYKFLVTYYEVDSLTGVPAFTPIHLITNMVYALESSTGKYLMYGDGLVYYVKLLVMAVFCTAIALFLYKKRPTEAAGRTMIFAITEPVAKLMVVFPVSILSGYLFDSVMTRNNGVGWFVFGCIFGFIVSCPLMEIIYRKDVKAVLKHPLQLVFNGVFLLAVIGVLHFDVFGYDTYIPKESKLESYAVSYLDLVNVYGGYGNSRESRLSNMAITDNESVRRLLEHAAEVTRPARTRGFDADSEKEYNFSSIVVKYRLNSGREIYRSYNINTADEQVMQWVSDMYDDMEYKMGAYPILTENPDRNYVGILLQYGYHSEDIPLPQEKMERFIETYQQELLTLTFDEIRNEYPVAKLSFAYRDAREEGLEETYAVMETVSYYESSRFTYDWEEYGYEIYPSFTQTIALLEEYGANIVNEITPEEVVSIRICDYSREVNDYDGLLTKEIVLEYTAEEHPEKVALILTNVMPNQMVNSFKMEAMEPNVDVNITYYIDGQERYESCQFYIDSMPEFLIQDMEEAAQ